MTAIWRFTCIAARLAVHMYRGQIGTEIAQRLAAHAEVLCRWLAALQARASAPD
jgi:hypothetical protein